MFWLAWTFFLIKLLTFKSQKDLATPGPGFYMTVICWKWMAGPHLNRLYAFQFTSLPVFLNFSTPAQLINLLTCLAHNFEVLALF